jgi:hypothetical protein
MQGRDDSEIYGQLFVIFWEYDSPAFKANSGDSVLPCATQVVLPLSLGHDDSRNTQITTFKQIETRTVISFSFDMSEYLIEKVS